MTRFPVQFTMCPPCFRAVSTVCPPCVRLVSAVCPPSVSPFATWRERRPRQLRRAAAWRCHFCQRLVQANEACRPTSIVSAVTVWCRASIASISRRRPAVCCLLSAVCRQPSAGGQARQTAAADDRPAVPTACPLPRLTREAAVGTDN